MTEVVVASICIVVQFFIRPLPPFTVNRFGFALGGFNSGFLLLNAWAGRKRSITSTVFPLTNAIVNQCIRKQH